MSANLPALVEPLTPADCDLRPYPTMPLDVQRLRDSATVDGDAEAFRAAVLLWCASWHQVPAASLPSDDRELAKLAGFGRFLEEWRKVKDEALRGFVQCSDGRLYHRVVAQFALVAWESRRKYLERSKRANEAKYAGQTRRKKPEKREASPTRSPKADQQGLPNGTERNGTEKVEKKEHPSGAPKKDARAKPSPRAKARGLQDTQKGSRLPVAWFATEKLRQYARDEGFDEPDIDRMEEDFRLWWPAQPGAKGRKTDWDRTWMTWVRTERKRRNERVERAGAGGRGQHATEGLRSMHSGFMEVAGRKPASR